MTRIQSAGTILEASKRWKEQCLLDGGSLLGSGDLWRNEYFRELIERIVNHPDEGNRSFEEKLKIQLSSASQESIQLCAEITWVYYLIVNSTSVKPATKRDQIRKIWSWSGYELAEDHWALADVLEQGILNPGVAFLTGRWLEFRFVFKMMDDWTLLSRQEREELLKTPWQFADWITSLEEGSKRQMRHAFLYLLFPDEFEPIVAVQHKIKIARVLGETNADVAKVNPANVTYVDKAVYEVSRRLEGQYPGDEISYYRSPIKELWQDDSNDPYTKSDEWYKERFGVVEAWVFAPGPNAEMWNEFCEVGIAGIGWELDDLTKFESRDAIREALSNSRGSASEIEVSTINSFVHEIAIGDIVLAKKGRKTILGWGKVTGQYRYEFDREGYRHTRSVDWKPFASEIDLSHLSHLLPMKTLTRYTSHKETIRTIFELANGAIRPPIYTKTTALQDLFMDEVQFDRILQSILLRKNLILQGPPGVGKTFIARRIAWCLVGQKDNDSVEMVQFHQSYSYEDFVQGWRPTESGGFALHDGVFYQFCKKAERYPDRSFMFIIDEINRGNLSRIFGELLMLIEADKRGSEFAIPLTYGSSDERFSVPSNMYILGLMNTADRSLAIVDYALRRRFAFETLKPEIESSKFRQHLLASGVSNELTDRIIRDLTSLNEEISKDKDLGSGFQIGHSYFVLEQNANDKEQWYRSVMESQIVPLLREYWFDRQEKVKELTDDFLS